MTLTTHILSGAAIGVNVENPYAIAGLSFLIHLILDAIPHGDYINQNSKFKDVWKIAVDLLLGTTILLTIAHQGWLFYASGFNILLGIFFSLLPDFFTFLFCHFKIKFLRLFKNFHENLHFFKNNSPERQFKLKNSSWELAIILILLLILTIR